MSRTRKNCCAQRPARPVKRFLPRARIQGHLDAAKQRLEDAEAMMIEKTKAAALATDEYVHDNPWRAVGIAAGVGLVIGMLISRGR